MNERKLIINFLTESGFRELGRDQYTKEGVGNIFIRQWNVQKVFFQIMELGEKHHANKLRELLMIKDATEVYIFNPMV